MRSAARRATSLRISRRAHLLSSQEKAKPYVTHSRSHRQGANAEAVLQGLRAVATRVGVVATAALRSVQATDAARPDNDMEASGRTSHGAHLKAPDASASMESLRNGVYLRTIRGGA